MNIFHISDIHYDTQNPEGIKKLQKIIQNINDQTTKPDVVAITGDLIWKCNKELYEPCFQELNKLQAPYLVITGNHDKSQDLQEALKQFSPTHPQSEDNHKLQYVCDKFPVRIIGLDTFKANIGGGDLSEESRLWLEQKLEDNSEGKPVVVLVHQYTLPTGSGFFDRHQAPWFEKFNQIVAAHANTVKLVLCGHLHNSVASHIGAVPLISGFSTNWAEEVLNATNDQPERDTERPLAFLIHHWYGKKFTTHTITVK